LSDKQIDNASISSPGLNNQSNLDLTSVKDIDELRSRLCTYIDTAENFYATEYQDKWNYFDNLYNGVRNKPEDTDPWRSNIACQIPFQSVQDELPKSLDGLIGDGDFFTFQPRPGKEHKKNKALAYADLVRYYYDKADFFSKTHDAMLSSKKLGIGWVKQTWHGDIDYKETYKEKDGKLVEERTEKLESGILLEVIDPNRAFPDPDAESMEEINKCGYFVEYTWVTRDFVDDMKEKVGAITKEINAFMNMALDKEQFERYLLYCVYTAKEIYWLVTGNGMDSVIRRVKNPYTHGHVPMYPVYKFKRPGYIIGTGLVEKLADYTEAFSDAINLTFDNWILAVNKHLAVKDDITIDPNLQKIGPGTVSRWNNPREDVQVLSLGDVSPSSFNMLQTFSGLAQQIAGSAAGITTPQGIQEVNNKTATGASILAYNEALTISLEVKINRDSYLKRILRDGIDLINQYVTDEQVARILPPEKAKLIRMEEDKDTFWDDFDFIIKGETGYVGKQREMEKASQTLQLIPAVEQVAAAVPTFNKELYYDMVFSSMDVPRDLVKKEQEPTALNIGDYTPEEQAKINQFSQATSIPVEMIMEMLDKGMTFEQIQAKAQEVKNGLSQSGQGGVQVPQ
jgi:hypothetical protein